MSRFEHSAHSHEEWALYGMEFKPGGLKACTPKQVLTIEKADRWDEVLPDGGQIEKNRGHSSSSSSSVCKHECHRIEYQARTSSRALDFDVIRAYLGDGVDPGNTAGVFFYFETFSFEKHVLQQETLADFVCVSYELLTMKKSAYT